MHKKIPQLSAVDYPCQLVSIVRILLVSGLLLPAACRRPSTQFAAMMSPVNQPADYGRYLKAGNEVMAIGNNPGWSLVINPSKGRLVFNVTGSDSLITAIPERQTDSDGVFRYTAPTGSGSLDIVFRPDSCVDKLSGQRLDYRVDVTRQGKTYMGCGILLRQLTLLQDLWVLTEFQGRPVAAGEPTSEVPRLEISLTEGRVMGTTGCNRLSGPVKADTRQILFGPLVTTKIACSGEVGTRETAFLNALREPIVYQIADGRLTLLRNGKSVMTFKKVD